jgi:signal transduction histidine kinase
MAKTSHRPVLRSRFLPWAVVGLSLAIVGATILLASANLRRKYRFQLIQQNSQILYTLWLSQEHGAESEGDLPITEKASSQLPLVLETAGLPQMARLLATLYGTRLFDSAGHFIVGDPNLSKVDLPPSDIALLRHLDPVGHFRPKVDLAEVNFDLPGHSPPFGPLLEISVPLDDQKRHKLLGIAQFVLDGQKMAAEFQTLDRNLAVQAAAYFVVAGGLLALALGVSFHQLLRVNQLLSERTQHLLEANQELALAAKTSAVGAITAHLLHGLKNPLSGLQSFVSSRGPSSEAEDEDWQLAVSSTRRMQTMISEVVRVLRDEQSIGSYEMSLGELVQMLASKVEALAREAGVNFQWVLTAQATLSNREANLINLILYNLIHNALQATPKGKAVILQISRTEGRIVCQVTDQGPGITAAQQKLLFKPCTSTKEHGSGVGLAISKQLANCIDGDLELESTGPHGSVFVLRFALKDSAPVPGAPSATASFGLTTGHIS